ncbi:aminoglycoside phosphotransferase [Rhodococcus sp. ABRD24]|uniref:phosphotransferase enzyme family protein n=1 Tax=Rhodococcus sp. ABRD24 TaxID=2507582 RepID=UPI00103F9EB4|nr:phosphotransferase [Rhodococcus sp. ABRD24]QBJ96630.1 aminoglycoside phosphotransferase [Rhodococcus sp. ABRD24]
MPANGVRSIDDAVAERALAEYTFSAGTRCRMINLSENATYLIEDPATNGGGILRVHREGYHSVAAVESELTWLEALRADGAVDAPAVIPARDGRRVVTVQLEGRTRHVVLFETMGGLEPDENGLTPADFETLGAVTARLHKHSKRWSPPAGFTRFTWDWEHCLGSDPRWGRWEDAGGVGPAEIDLLRPAVALLRERLEGYGQESDRFGLIHADLRLANLLVEPSRVNVIDFDDCGFGWFLYDFGTAVSFMEHDPALGQWQAAWLAGYRSEAELAAEDEAMLPTFVLLRRMLLLAWMGSHAHSRESRTKSASFAVGTCDLAERYLRSGGLSLL